MSRGLVAVIACGALILSLSLGGVVYDATGSYDGVWIASIVLGVAAAFIHMPIAESPVPRLALLAPCAPRPGRA
jgi:hypothetical protein